MYFGKSKPVSHVSRCLSYQRSYQKKPDYYERLGVRQDATTEEIKAAFYAKSKELHPDHGADGNSTGAFVELKEAYDVLRRPADRRAYDELREMEKNQEMHRNPYHHYTMHRNQQQQRARQWSQFWDASPGTTGNMRDSEYKRRSDDQWQFILKWAAFGLFLVVLYDVGYVLLLRTIERRISKLDDKDEIAKSFMRQRELRDSNLDESEMYEIGQLLKGDIDEAWRMRHEAMFGKNPNEIREEYRWLRAVQDADHTRRVKAERAERRRKERLAARLGSDADVGQGSVE